MNVEQHIGISFVRHSMLYLRILHTVCSALLHVAARRHTHTLLEWQAKHYSLVVLMLMRVLENAHIMSFEHHLMSTHSYCLNHID